MDGEQVNAIAAFVRDRDKALLSFDVATVNAHQRKYGGAELPNNEVGLLAIHKAVTAALSIPQATRQASADWLLAHNSKPLS